MHILLTETEVWGVFTTEESAKEAKKELVDKEFAEWLSDGCGIDELLAEATREELTKYAKNEITLEEFHCYQKTYNDWAECYYIVPIELNKIQQINFN